MYQIVIYNGNAATMIHDYRATERKNKLSVANITTAINAIDALTFTIYPNNDGYESLQPFYTVVKVWNTQKARFDFVGRVISATPEMDNNGKVYKSVVCEGRYAYLRDSLQMYVALQLYVGDESRTAVQEFIDVLLAVHNEQMPAEKQIQRGNVTMAAGENVYCAIDYTTTFDVLKTKLLDVYGGEMRVREENGVLYLDYVEQFGTTRSTKIAVARNMQSARRELDATGIITRLIPLGHKLTTTETNIDENGKETTTEIEIDERLTIASVNDGVNYVEDKTAAELYGVIYGVQIWDDVTLPQNLKSKGETWLIENNRIAVTNTITALDLSIIGLDIDDIVCGDSYPTENPLIGLDDILRVVKKSINVVQPQKSTFEMGNKSLSLSDFLISDTANISDLVGQIGTNATEIKNVAQNLTTTIDRRAASAIYQSEQAILATVEKTTVTKDEYSEFSENVKHVLEISADGTTMLFQRIDESINNINGTVQSNYEELIKYIRFVDGNIILGQEGNEITLTIQHNRISFQQNGVEVAYLSNSNLYIGNAIVQAGGKLQIGNFAFVPRSDGSLSLLKVQG